MNREETIHAARELGSSPAAHWIGNKLADDGRKLLQKCTRCGAEETLELPSAMIAAFRFGARGAALANLVPAGFDEKLFAWKKEFQYAHEGCDEDEAA